MNDHIGKPIDINQLFVSLARWIQPRDPTGNAVQSIEPRLAVPKTYLPNIPSLDLNQAMRRMGGNTKLMRKLIDRFGQTQGDAIARIQSAIELQDMETATREAHTVKGLAGNIGATQLLAKAGAVEGLLRHGTVDELPAALVVMEQELSLVIGQIASAMGPAPARADTTAPPLMVDRTVLASDLRELAALLADDDSRAAKVADSIAEKLRALGQGPVSAQLQKRIAKYEFEEALDALKEAALALNIPLALEEKE
jgi:two-component system sensor histidine kinase/response regulator